MRLLTWFIERQTLNITENLISFGDFAEPKQEK